MVERLPREKVTALDEKIVNQRSEGLILHHQLLKPLNGIIEVQVSEVTSIWFNGTVAVISKKSGTVQTVFTKERIDIRYALAEVA